MKTPMPHPIRESLALEARHELDGRASLARPPRTWPLAFAHSFRRRSRLVRGVDIHLVLLFRMDGQTSRAAAARVRGATAARRVSDEARESDQSRGLQAAAQRHRALLRRPVTAASRQDGSAEPARGHLAGGRWRGPRPEAFRAFPRAAEGF